MAYLLFPFSIIYINSRMPITRTSRGKGNLVRVIKGSSYRGKFASNLQPREKKFGSSYRIPLLYSIVLSRSRDKSSWPGREHLFVFQHVFRFKL